MAKMPKQKPGKSEQVVCTPKEFLDNLRHRLGIWEFEYDLAASPDNTVAKNYFTEEDDSLVQDWSKIVGWTFCNPPYEDIEPWVAKASMDSLYGAEVAMLVPASVGSNWWKEFVHNKAYVLFLNGRITFVGHTSPYPKDLAVLLYTPWEVKGYDVWKWKK